MVSRRAFLAGAFVAVGGGAAAVVAAGPRKVLHEVGIVRSPDHRVPPSDWPIISQVLTSAAMQREVPWAIAVPSTSTTGVVICLHGRNGDHREAFDSVHVHDVVRSQLGTLAVVGVDGGAHSYWHPRAGGTDALRMVIEELIPAVDAYLGASLPLAVMGWSMGGYGALLVAEHAPDRIRAVAATSPSMWRRFADASDGAFDSDVDFTTFDVFAGVDALASTVVRVDCGTDDDFEDVSRAFADLLPGGNPGSFTPGFHDAGYFRSVAPAQLATIADALGTSAAAPTG